jgi:RNA polymerase sigma-70 factor (ECF subfamily)
MATRNLTVSDVQRLEALSSREDVAFQMDEQTFRAFYDRTARPLWAYLSRITGDRQLSDDLLQDAYYRFLRADATYENEAHRRNALFRIATNLARDSHRRAQVRPLGHTNADDDVTMVADQRVDVAGQMQTKTDLGRAMQQLKPRERALLWLAYAEGSSHREIATAVGVKLTSVKLLLFRARRKLAGILEERNRHE